MPIRLKYRLPSGWVPSPSDDPDAVFTAVHPASRSDFTAYMTAEGELRDDDADLRDVADEMFAPLFATAEAVTITGEIDTGSADAPGLTRLVDLRLEVDGQVLDVVQCQVLVTAPDTREPRKRAVLRFTLTATPEQAQMLASDFEQFVDSMEPVNETSS